MTPPLDLTKPVQTRDGRPARIICTDRKWQGQHPMIALVNEDGHEAIGFRRADGSYHDDGTESPNDLINAPVKREGWVNVYGQGKGNCPLAIIYPTREEADKHQVSRVACVHVEWEEGSV